MSAAMPADSGSAADAAASAAERNRESDAVHDTRSSAAQRLAESRERLRQWMLHGDSRHQARRRVAAAEAGGDSPSWLDRLRGLPVVGLLVDAAASWWEHHPLQPAAGLAQGVVHDSVAPMARRHPLAVVALAFASGCAIAWLRPWRWLVKPALLTGLVSHMAARLVREVPFEAMLGAIAAFAHTRANDDDEDDELARTAAAAEPARAMPAASAPARPAAAQAAVP